MTYNQIISYRKHIIRLDPKEKKICLKAMAHLARLDGFVDEDEKAFIADMAKRYGLETSVDLFVPQEEADLLEDLAQIGSRPAGLELIKELCFLGHADDNLSPEEILFIGHAGQAMGIALKKIEEISDWVVDRMIWEERGKLIMEETTDSENNND